MRKILLILLVLLMTSCGAPATEMGEAPAATEPPAATQPEIASQSLSSPTAPAPTSTSVPPTLTPPPPTVEATQTETPLPTLELPTPVDNPAALVAWDGGPTYLGDSKPGFAFRVLYDPQLWGLTTDNFGAPALGHRTIENCIIAPASGRGLPSNMTVDHDVRKIGPVELEISTAYQNGEPQFVTYLGGDANIYTGFEVSFKEEVDLCISEAETVLGSLTSVPVSQATPVP